MIPLVKVKLVENNTEEFSCDICYYGTIMTEHQGCPTDGNANLLCCEKDIRLAIWQEYDIPTKLKEHVIAGQRYKQVNATMGCHGCSFYDEPNMKCKITHGYNEITNNCTNNGKIWKQVYILGDCHE